jgi:fructose-1,6-bisphosphatase/sedoheptulose 1,7-bisphosphatase-like protein
VLAAAALQCIGGDMQGQLVFRNEREKERARQMMETDDIQRVFQLSDLAHGDIVFAATGVTTGDMLPGVRFTPSGCHTYSLVMRAKSGTIRSIHAEHHFDRKPNYSSQGLVQEPNAD